MDIEVTGFGFGLGDVASVLHETASGLLVPGDGDIYVAPPTAFRFRGNFERIECVRGDGTTRWVDDANNSIVAAARDDILNTYFRQGTPATALYLGLVDNAGFTQFQDADTLVAHSGWVEFTGITGNRGQWSPGASASQSITNAATVNFAISANGTVRGLFCCTAASGTTGLLISTAPFSAGNQPVVNGDTLKVTYTISATST